VWTKNLGLIPGSFTLLLSKSGRIGLISILFVPRKENSWLHTSEPSRYQLKHNTTTSTKLMTNAIFFSLAGIFWLVYKSVTKKGTCYQLCHLLTTFTQFLLQQKFNSNHHTLAAYKIEIISNFMTLISDHTSLSSSVSLHSVLGRPRNIASRFLQQLQAWPTQARLLNFLMPNWPIPLSQIQMFAF